jgi:hypothetical protein
MATKSSFEMTSMHLPDPEDRLDSWKEIAVFLHRTVRTVQRWEKTAGLPIRRGGPGRRSAVVASRREIDEWWQQQRGKLLDEEPVDGPDGSAAVAQESRPRRWRLIAGLLVGGLAVAATLLIIAGPLVRARPAVIPAMPRFARALALVTSEGYAPKTISMSSPPAGLVATVGGDRLFVALPEESAVAVIDTALGEIRDRLPAVEGAFVLDLSADGRHLVVGGALDVGVIDLHRRALRTVALGRRVYDLRIGGGSRVWVTLGRGGLWIVDLASLETRSVATVGCPMFLAYGRRTERLFVSYQCHGPGGRAGHDAIELFDEPAARSVIARSGPPLVGSRIALSFDEAYLWADTHDACSSPTYDQVGCPPGAGPVFLALRASTLEPIEITRYPLPVDASAAPVYLPGDARVVFINRGVYVVNATLWQIEEAVDGPIWGEPHFVPRLQHLYVASGIDNRLFEFPFGPAEDARSLPGLGTYWSGDGMANDAIGGTHGVTTGSTRYAPGRFGQAFMFDGSAAGISFDRRIDVDITEGPSTYAAWIRPGAASGTILARASVKGWAWRLRDGRIEFCLMRASSLLACDGGGVTGREPLSNGVWSHVAVVRTASELSLFVDARQVASASLRDYVAPQPSDSDESPEMRLGAGRNGDDPFRGAIDEVAMFQRALDSSELTRLMRLSALDARQSR